jgi:hypothetical protein
VEFLNCNLLLDEIGIDPSSHYADGVHLNAFGSTVFSEYIGKYLKDNYELTDRRGDSRYASWQECANYSNQYVKDVSLRSIQSFDTIMTDYISNPNYWVAVSADGTCSSSNRELKLFFDKYGIDTEDAFNGVWLIKGGELAWGAKAGDDELYIRTEHRDFCLRHSYTNELIVDNQQYEKVSNGLNLIIFDTQTNVIADVIGIDIDNDCNVNHFLAEN